MGRVLRMVPPNWEHPIDRWPDGRTRFRPMLNETFEEAAAEWNRVYAQWQSGWRPDYWGQDEECWDYLGPPPEDPSRYTPWTSAEATWFQVWENVSEGTPVTPPFATRQELVDYLVQHGDFSDQRWGYGPWDRRAAERLVNEGVSAPSLVMTGNQVMRGVDALAKGGG